MTFAAVSLPILLHADEEAPRECCGFVFERAGKLLTCRIRNAAGTDTEFFIDPRDQYVAENAIAEQGGKIRAIYHSHPQGTPRPSKRDCDFAAGWPGIAMLIAAEGVVRAYDASGEAL